MFLWGDFCTLGVACIRDKPQTLLVCYGGSVYGVDIFTAI
jgi:hypothetical protein